MSLLHDSSNRRYNSLSHSTQCVRRLNASPAELIPYLGSHNYVRAITDMGAMKDYQEHEVSQTDGPLLPLLVLPAEMICLVVQRQGEE